jgi:hypothetical protein
MVAAGEWVGQDLVAEWASEVISLEGAFEKSMEKIFRRTAE